MSTQESQLMELLVAVAHLEARCKHLHAAVAVPPVVYERIDQLRNEIARWGTECVVLTTKKGASDDNR